MSLDSVIHEHVLGPQGLAAWRDRPKQVVVGQRGSLGLWQHEGTCQPHAGVGVGQVENGKNIFAKETELQNVLPLW